MIFDINGDYKEEFKAEVKSLIDLKIENREKRIIAVNDLIETYIKEIGLRPENFQIELLTDYLLKEELKDKDPHKMKHGKVDFTSHTQLARRKDKERPLEQFEYKLTSDKKYKSTGKRYKGKKFKPS